jgi:hypothetical protein
MSNDSGRTSSDIVLGIVVVFLASLFVLFILRGLHLGGLMPWGPSLGGLFPHGPSHSILPFYVWTFAGLGWLLNLILAVWVTIDANRRGMNGVLWGVLVFFTCVVGLIVYLIVAGTAARNGAASRAASAAPASGQPAAPPSASCPGCRASIQPEFLLCPYCGRTLQEECPGCGRHVEAGWKVCPHCAVSLEGPAPSPAPGGAPAEGA